MILHCDVDLKDSKSIFLEDYLAHNDAQPYQPKDSAIQKISSGQIFINILKFAVTFTLNTTIPFSIQYSGLW